MQQQHGRMSEAQFQLMMETKVRPTVYADDVVESLPSVDSLLDSIQLEAIKTVSKIEAFKIRAKELIAKNKAINSIAVPRPVQWYPCGICGDPRCPLGSFDQ